MDMSPARMLARAISTEQATQARLRHAAFSCADSRFPENDAALPPPPPGPGAIVERLQFLFQIFFHAASGMFEGAHGRVGMIVRVRTHAFLRDQDCAHDHIAADNLLKLPVKSVLVLVADAAQFFW